MKETQIIKIKEKYPDIFAKIRMFYVIESRAIMNYEEVSPHLPNEEMRQDFFWHNEQEKKHAYGFEAFLKKHLIPTEYDKDLKDLDNLFSYGNYFEHYIDPKRLKKGQQYFSDIDLYAFFTYMAYQERVAANNYFAMARIVAEKDILPDLQSMLNAFGNDELAHADYGDKWLRKLTPSLVSMQDIRARGKIQRTLSYIKKSAYNM